MKVLQDKQNELLNRKEIKIVVEAGKNPTFDEATEIVAKEFKANKEGIKIKKIIGKFGRNTFLITANIYKNKTDLDKTEVKKKKEIEEEKKAAEEAKKAEEEAAKQKQEQTTEQPQTPSTEEKQEDKKENSTENN